MTHTETKEHLLCEQDVDADKKNPFCTEILRLYHEISIASCLSDSTRLINNNSHISKVLSWQKLHQAHSFCVLLECKFQASIYTKGGYVEIKQHTREQLMDQRRNKKYNYEN